MFRDLSQGVASFDMSRQERALDAVAAIDSINDVLENICLMFGKLDMFDGAICMNEALAGFTWPYTCGGGR